MSLKIVLDMNLSPDLVEVFQFHGWETVHWSQIGAGNAKDRVIMEWAKENGYVVVSHDLDFGDILAVTNADSPSVIQVRTQDLLGEALAETILAALKQYRDIIEAGALIIISQHKLRARVLPLKRGE
jgi:predicted nuclease of predicted toxin-antitoxin system